MDMLELFEVEGRLYGTSALTLHFTSTVYISVFCIIQRTTVTISLYRILNSVGISL
jgi:hypothetical protein